MLAGLALAGMMAAARAEEPPIPPYPGTTVSVDHCGDNAAVAVGSTPYSGTVVPGSTTLACDLHWNTTTTGSPFGAVVDGTTGPTANYVAPVCNVQIQGPRTVWTVEESAAGLRLLWDYFKGVLTEAPRYIQWQCQYPWTPEPATSQGKRR